MEDGSAPLTGSHRLQHGSWPLSDARSATSADTSLANCNWIAAEAAAPASPGAANASWPARARSSGGTLLFRYWSWPGVRVVRMAGCFYRIRPGNHRTHASCAFFQFLQSNCCRFRHVDLSAGVSSETAQRLPGSSTPDALWVSRITPNAAKLARESINCL